MFTWHETAPIENPLGREKVSFHASGVIAWDGGRGIGVNLRLLEHRTFLCAYFPKHPDNWRSVEAGKRGDLVISQLLGDGCPITVELYYEPAGKVPLLASNLAQGCFVVPFAYTGVDVHGRVVLHLAFRRTPKAETWAPHWAMVWPKMGRRTLPFDEEHWFEPYG